MINANMIALIAAGTLAVLILSAVGLPFIAAMNHVTYEVNQTIVTGAIAALSGIISAVAVKKIQNGD